MDIADVQKTNLHKEIVIADFTQACENRPHKTVLASMVHG